MSYVAPDPDAYMGTPVGDGQCVAYVKKAAACPVTSQWAEGKKVKGADLAPGTAIATFQGGVYGNYTDGRSHAAIYISQDATGLQVHDQWKKRDGSVQVVHSRRIRFKGGAGEPRNDGDAFNVIENQSVLIGVERWSASVNRQSGSIDGAGGATSHDFAE